MAVPADAKLSSAQPETVTVPDTVAPLTGLSIHTAAGASATVTVTLLQPTSGVASVSEAQTERVCAPDDSDAVFNANVKPTLGHPGRPPNASHTSLRGNP